MFAQQDGEREQSVDRTQDMLMMAVILHTSQITKQRKEEESEQHQGQEMNLSLSAAPRLYGYPIAL